MILSTIAMTAVGLQGTGATLISNFAKAIHQPETLRVNFTYNEVGAAPARYAIEFSKPNKARIDGPDQLVVADGANIVTLDKKANTYFKRTQSDAEFRSILMGDGVILWSAFFFPEVIQGLPGARAMGQKNRAGMNLDVVEVSIPNQNTSYTLYLNPESKVLRQAEVTTSAGNAKTVRILDAREVSLGNAPNTDAFTFKAPSNARQVTEEEMYGAKWFTNINEALAAAKSSNRMVLLDFYTDWCVFCKKLDAEVFSTQGFKDMSKYFVFCKINAERPEQMGPVEALGLGSGIQGFPTNRILTKDGKMVAEIVGFKPLQDFVADMNRARQNAN